MPAAKLTIDVQAAFVEATGAGAPVRHACRAVGVSLSSYKRWMKRGRKAGDENAIYREFRRATIKARGQAVVEMLAIVKKAAPNQWQAAMCWLERRYPKDFGRVDPIRLREFEELKSKLDRLEALVADQQAEKPWRNR